MKKTGKPWLVRQLPVLPCWSLADVPVYAITLRRSEYPVSGRHALELLAWWFGAGCAGCGWLLQLQRMNPGC